jgi:hypothetical protein
MLIYTSQVSKQCYRRQIKNDRNAVYEWALDNLMKKFVSVSRRANFSLI